MFHSQKEMIISLGDFKESSKQAKNSINKKFLQNKPFLVQKK